MENWKKTIVSKLTPIKEAIKVIDSGSLQIALVVDENYKLLGTITDGDVRRGILKNISMNDPVYKIMQSKPIIAKAGENREKVLARMKEKQINQIPYLDQEGRVKGLEIIRDLLNGSAKDNPVLLMVGGLGSRLQPITNDLPKPMIKVGGKPILERILEDLIEYGFRKFYFSVFYKSEMIQEYFGDGSRWNVEIRYIREQKRMGTAGALSLLPEKPSSPILIMNGDLVTKVNFQHLFDFHQQQSGDLTVCVREYDFQVPYGVIKMSGHCIAGIDEKPVHKFFVNAGIYLMEPALLRNITKNRFLDMTQLIEKLKSKKKILAFPIREYWLDIGRHDDLKRATEEIESLFK